MRSDKVFEALHTLQNRYMLCQIASKATRKFHKPNTRIQDTTADGVNLHDGVSHVTVQNTFVRNTGDDGMAMWSDQNADHDNAFIHDTVAQPQLANGFAVYGGHDNTVSDDIAADTVTQGGGIHVGNRFGSVPVSGTTTIAGDVLLRAGDLVMSRDEATGDRYPRLVLLI